MLDPWIIEEIQRRERENEESRRLPLELPLPIPYEDPTEEASPPPVERGVIIIEN